MGLSQTLHFTHLQFNKSSAVEVIMSYSKLITYNSLKVNNNEDIQKCKLKSMDFVTIETLTYEK